LGRYSLAELAIFDVTIRANHWVLLCCDWDFLWLSRHSVEDTYFGTIIDTPERLKQNQTST